MVIDHSQAWASRPSPSMLYMDPSSTTHPRKFDLVVDPENIYITKPKKGRKGSPTSAVESGVETDSDFSFDSGPSFLIIGFDTENIDHPTDSKKNVVLSYQFHAILSDSEGKLLREWTNIGYPESGKRISRSDFFSWVYAEGFKKYPGLKLPDFAYLVGHFTRADLPAFADFREFRNSLNAVRNSFISVNRLFKGNNIALHQSVEVKPFYVRAPLRDTFLLCPASSRSLKAVGDLLHLEKIDLPSEDDICHMDRLLEQDRSFYERYALRDAEICARYSLRIIQLRKLMKLSAELPPTLTSIGVSHLMEIWKAKSPTYLLDVLGQEEVIDEVWSSTTGRRKSKKIVSQERRRWYGRPHLQALRRSAGGTQQRQRQS